MTNSDTLEWKPWETFRKEPDVLPIQQPPCWVCEHWMPVRVYDSDGKYMGVRCCMSEEMYFDFSCYKARHLGENK